MEGVAPENHLIILKGLEGYPPPHLVPMQQYLLPYLGTLEQLWWILWGATLIYVLINHLLVPIFAEWTKKNKTMVL